MSSSSHFPKNLLCIIPVCSPSVKGFADRPFPAKGAALAKNDPALENFAHRADDRLLALSGVKHHKLRSRRQKRAHDYILPGKGVFPQFLHGSLHVLQTQGGSIPLHQVEPAFSEMEDVNDGNPGLLGGNEIPQELDELPLFLLQAVLPDSLLQKPGKNPVVPLQAKADEPVDGQPAALFEEAGQD